MTEWINIDIDTLRAGKASALIDAYASAALGTGQEEPIDKKIANVCQTIRIAIENGKRTRVSASEGAIPPSLEDLAVRLICWNLQSRLNVRKNLEPTAQDVKDHETDLRKLERIEEGKTAVEDPTDPIGATEVQSGAATAALISSRPRQSTRESMRGL